MAETVYILCALTSLVCAVLLWRGYRRTPTRLLFWSCLCFAGLTINNVLLMLDLVIFPNREVVDLSFHRNATGLLAICLLVYGLVWDSE